MELANIFNIFQERILEDLDFDLLYFSNIWGFGVLGYFIINFLNIKLINFIFLYPMNLFSQLYLFDIMFEDWAIGEDGSCC